MVGQIPPELNSTQVRRAKETAAAFHRRIEMGPRGRRRRRQCFRGVMPLCRGGGRERPRCTTGARARPEGAN